MFLGFFANYTSFYSTRMRKRNRTNKLRIYNFFWKLETDQKLAEMDWWKEETTQQT